MKVQLCHWAGCDSICNDYYCAKHKPLADQRRKQREEEHKKELFKGTKRTTSQPYHNLYNCARWRNLRRDFLKEHSMCVICGGKADTVDHIFPHKGDLEMFYNMNNLQAMCHSCHSAKTLREDVTFNKKNFDR